MNPAGKEMTVPEEAVEAVENALVAGHPDPLHKLGRQPTLHHEAIRCVDAALPAITAHERKRVLGEIRALAPHELSCDCPAHGIAALDQHAPECPRGAVGLILDAIEQRS